MFVKTTAAAAALFLATGLTAAMAQQETKPLHHPTHQAHHARAQATHNAAAQVVPVEQHYRTMPLDRDMYTGPLGR